MTKQYPLVAKYKLVDDTENLIKILVSVKKKRVRKATDRNRLKRSIRESYRLLKPLFSGREIPDNKGLHVALILTADATAKKQHISESLRTVFTSIFERLNTPTR